MNKYGIQRLFAWSGMIAVTLFFFGLLFSSFIPPPSPSWPQEQVVAHYQQHATGIRIGMVLMMISGMFMAPMVGVISEQLKRIPGVSSSIVYAQISAGTLGAVFFIIPAVLFIVTAFRPDRPPELTYMLNDFSWIMLVIPWSPAFIQNCVIGLAVLNDRSPQPIFPRWLGFANFWVALAFVPGGLLAFFKSGPFAWNGLLVFWLAATAFFIWFVAMTTMLLKAVKRQEREEASV